MAVNEDEVDSRATCANKECQTSSSGSQFQFSKELGDFYESHNFDLSGDSVSCPYRYIRLNPRYDEQQTLDMLRMEMRNQRENSSSEEPTDKSDDKNTLTDVLRVPWLETKWAFYALPESFSLSSSPCFRSGRIYGMDVSSGAGVAVLLSGYHDSASAGDAVTPTGDNLDELRVLDLCCSPGLKLLQMADCFHHKTFTQKPRPVKVVGVDVCEHRMNVCKSIVQKYFIDSETSGRSEESHVGIQLYRQDGTTFGVRTPASTLNLVFDSGVAMEEMVQRGGKRKRMNKSARAREKKRLRQIASVESDSVPHGMKQGLENKVQTNIGLFDYVLVDAECSTDGSFKHIKERIKEASSNKRKDIDHKEENTRLTDPSKLADLVDLQRKLIASGFRLLKEGGTLVYSTCSLSEDQNEKVVTWLLDSHEDAVLIPIHFPLIEKSKFVTQGSLEGTVRFYPNLVKDTKSATLLLGDGFFVAKLKKRRKGI
mmetsp:Transcript_8897/g.18486  ORF Transcript_8897/g.18486 Transcript_8897/m.18486 type:complete len:483 (-) Transcript_8897:38-1486(-)